MMPGSAYVRVKCRFNVLLCQKFKQTYLKTEEELGSGDFRISNVFDHIFREKLTGASILEWGKSFADIQVLKDQNTVEMDVSGDENSQQVYGK